MSTNTDINNEPTSDSVQRTRNNEQATYNYKERLSLQTQETKDSKTKKAGLGKLPPPAAVDAKSVQARTEAVIKREELHGKRELVAPTMSLGNKGRSAGFYCEACDLTFKDSNSYLDHLNSSGHYRKLGISGKVEYATLEQVRARLGWLKERKIEMEKNKGEDLDLSKRIAARRKMEEDQRQERRDKKKAKRMFKRQQQMGSDVEM